MAGHLPRAVHSYGNALAEMINGFYKTEVVQRHQPWRNLETIESAILE